MHIKILSVGKLKEKYLKDGTGEYAKRLSRYCKFEMVEVPDLKAPENLSQKQMEDIIEKEGEMILQKINDQDFVVAMAIEGDLTTSEQMAEMIEQCGVSGKSRVVFVIGGSLGLSAKVKKRAQVKLSFGRITLPHQLMRLVLSEQIYRSFRIIHRQSYHK